MKMVLTHIPRVGWTNHMTLREKADTYTWGTYGKPAKVENFERKLLKDLTTDHLGAILSTESHIRNTDYIEVITYILDERSRNNTHFYDNY